MDMSVTLMMEMALWVYIYPQTCPVIHIQYAHLFKWQLHLNKVFFKTYLKKRISGVQVLRVLDRINTRYINMKYT